MGAGEGQPGWPGASGDLQNERMDVVFPWSALATPGFRGGTVLYRLLRTGEGYRIQVFGPGFALSALRRGPDWTPTRDNCESAVRDLLR